MQITIISRKNHSISRKNISKNALNVLHRLHKSGYEAYLVGGGVRDLLLGKSPKDWDITTNATPEQMRKLFRNCRLVGRRFRLVHIMFDQEVIEVATFRGHLQAEESINARIGKNGILLRDNIFGTIEDDAHRRDLTINSLYYSVRDFTVRDYVGGLQDLRRGIVRLIGDPEIRYREDPVRMLRVVRFAAKLDMTIEENTVKPIPRLASLLNNIPPTRLFEEALKLLHTGYGYQTYLLLRKHQLFQLLFPVISRAFTDNSDSLIEQMLKLVLQNTDTRIQNQIFVNPAFLFAAIFWYPQQENAQRILQDNGLTWYDAFIRAMNSILNEACSSLAIPKRITMLIRDIWQLQLRITRFHGQRALRLMKNPKFHTAHDLLSMRAKVENSHGLQQLTNWWSEFQSATPSKQNYMLKNFSNAYIPNYQICKRTIFSHRGNSSNV